MNKRKRISVIIPCRNEEKYIKQVIESIVKGTYPLDDLEVLVVDGRSTDKTRKIVKKLIEKFSQIKLIDNPEKTVPYAMNYGIKEAKGEILIRMDAHSIYPEDYVEKLVYWLEKLDADNVGGVWEIVPSNNTLVAKAIALATSHPFGIGNAQYKTTNRKEPYEVDTVPFGCYKKEVFEKIGLYDTDLTRNQDDELNARLKQNGGKIYLIPEVKIKYFARDSLIKTAKMFYQYGLFKPLVNLKLKKPATVRQFVPLLLVTFIIFGGLLSIFFRKFLYVYLSGLFFYLAVNFLVSLKLSIKHKDIKLLPYLMLAFLIIHISYGFGYLKGIIDFVVLKKHKKTHLTEISLSR